MSRFSKMLDSNLHRGATVLEMVVVLAIIVLFAGLVVPEVKNYFSEAKAAKIAAVYQSVSNGAIRFWSDTGQYGIENGEQQDINNHQLFYAPKPKIPGWSGAYIEHPLTSADNPFNEAIYLVNEIGHDYDLNGDGNIVAGEDGLKGMKGNELVFLVAHGDMNDPVFKKVDDIIDGKAGVTGQNWQDIGRVKLDPNSRIFTIFVFSMDKN